MDFEYYSCGASKKGRHQDNLFSSLDMLSTFLYSMIVATFLVLLPLESFLSGSPMHSCFSGAAGASFNTIVPSSYTL